ncbi:hypothetical protein AB0M80_31005 [Amycolatopsis sp. NPDC051045]|uniref:hypothetical protein n=1 Tax=Amycolatopsis sp. NPDC051045 TaxID=3156922 RepID=UPI0034339012
MLEVRRFGVADEFPLVGGVVAALGSNELPFVRPRKRGKEGPVNGRWLWWSGRIGVIDRRRRKNGEQAGS